MENPTTETPLPLKSLPDEESKQGKSPSTQQGSKSSGLSIESLAQGHSNASLRAWVQQSENDASLVAQLNRVVQEQQVLIRELAGRVFTPNAGNRNGS